MQRSASSWLSCAAASSVPPSEHVTFVQIGANDGIMCDPLHDVIIASKRRWRGVLVEPVPYLMYRLRHKTYRSFTNDFMYVEAAIAPTCAENGTITFFTIDPRNLSESHWMNGISSLSVPRSRQASTYSRIVVACMTVHDLADQINLHGVNAPLILLIDVEGYDAVLVQALRTWPFGRPQMILFELWPPKELPENTYFDVFSFLNENGYVVVRATGSADYVALDVLAD